MTPSELSKEELIKVQEKSNKDSVIIHLKAEARRKSLSYCPNRKVNNEGNEVLLSAAEITYEAEIIYQWLIKDL
jgi:hypothetical protein